VQSLLDKSLLRFSNERYWMLGTIHELAEEKLGAGGSADELRRRHAEYFLELGLSLGLTMESLERVRVQRHDVAIAEQNNFRAAIDWAADADPELAVGIAFALENFWVTHDPHEGVRRFDALLQHENELPVELRAAAHRCRGNVRIMSGDRPGGVADYEAAVAGFRAAGNDVGALAAEHRALINREVGDLDERRRGLEGLLERFRALGLGTGEVQVLGSLAGIEARLGGKERAAELLEEAVERAASIGFVWVERAQRDALARLYLEYGRVDDARDQGLRALELATRAGDRLGTVYALTFFALFEARRGDNDEAGALWGALEAEAGRGPLGIWAAEERARVEASLPLDDADFARGRERGALMSLDEAVDAVLASID
jgi:tetratricopeptide (TPR) repeat protein